jgi:transposase
LMLMPPSVADWLPDDHLAWFVLDVVAELDLSAFRSAYRRDGRGGAAYDPQLMLALLVYAYSIGERSSRRIERRLLEDVAFRVVAANQQPDHATIARFRATHQDAIAGLFGRVLSLVSRAGMIRPGLVAIDGTKLTANASRDANRTAQQLAKEILDEAAAIDIAEDAEQAARGGGQDTVTDPELRTRQRRRARVRALLDELEADAKAKSYETHMAKRDAVEASTGCDPNGRQPSKTFKTKREASAFLASIESSQHTSSCVDPHAGRRVAFGGYAPRWLEGQNTEITTRARDKSIMSTHLVPYWSRTPLSHIDHSAVQRWVAGLSDRLSPATVHQCHRLFSGVMKAAVRDRLLVANPADGIRLPKQRRHPGSERTISREDFRTRLLPAVP